VRVLLRLVSLRRLIGVPLRTTLSVVGISLGVAVLVAVSLVNESVLHSIGRGVEAVAGKADLEVSAGATGVAEEVLDAVRGVEGVTHAAPIIEVTANVLGPAPVAGEGLQIVGLDTLGDDYFNEDPLEGEARVEVEDPVAFLNAVDSLLLAKPFADRAGIEAGGVVRVATAEGVKALRVRGILHPGGLTRANGGDVAMMDIYAMQIAFGKERRFDRIQVAIGKGLDRDVVARRIRTAVGSGVDVEPPARRASRVERMMGGLQAGLLVGSAVALLVGVFLIYNTVSIAVVERRREIGTLRALGTPRAWILRMFAIEAAVQGLLGGILGVPLGVGLSKGLLRTVSTAVSSLYLRMNVTAVQADARLAAAGIALGLGVTLVASLFPARAAASVSPVETLRSGRNAPPAPAFQRRILAVAGIGLLVVALCAALLPPVDGRPMGGYAAAFLILIGWSLCIPTLLSWMERPMRAFATALFGVPGRVAADNLARAPARTAVTVAALAVAVAMVVNVSTFMKSIQSALERWIVQSVPADLFVSASAGFIGVRNTPLRPDLGDALARIDGVEAVDLVRLAQANFGRERIFILSNVASIWMQHGRSDYLQGSRDDILDCIRRDDVGVSENFARRFGLWRGDSVALRTPTGMKRYRICSVFVDYTAETGIVSMDRTQYVRDFGDSSVDSFDLYLAPAAAGRIQDIRRQVVRQFGRRYDLQVRTNRELRELIMSFVDQMFQIMQALEFVALIIAVLGVANTLVASVLDRTRELGILRAIGASRRQVRGAVLAEATLIGLSASALGAPSGLLVSLLVLKVVNLQVRGWAIPYEFNWSGFGMTALLVTAAAAIAGVLPANRATAVEPVVALRAE